MLISGWYTLYTDLVTMIPFSYDDTSDSNGNIHNSYKMNYEFIFTLFLKNLH